MSKKKKIENLIGRLVDIMENLNGIAIVNDTENLTKEHKKDLKAVDKESSKIEKIIDKLYNISTKL